VHGLHRIRTCENQNLIAAFQGRTAEILGREVHLLQRGAGGAVEHQHRSIRGVQTLEKAHARRGGGGVIDPGACHHHQPSMRTRDTQWS
jgi:hypothetical protein